MKISVVVPVYNAEKYLKKCIDSVIAQTYTAWEMILVNDGSKDHSLEILQNYAQTDSRIRVINQTNSGPGQARNTGIDNATGDYIVFLDSDDYIDPDYFSMLKPKAEKADIVFVDVLQVNPDGQLIAIEPMSAYKRKNKDALHRSMMTGKVPWGGVRKAVRLATLNENHIRYTALNIGEESLYSFRVVEAASSIDFLDEKPVYMYVNHKESQSKLTMDDPWGGAVKLLQEYIAEDKEKYAAYANTLNAFNAAATVVSIDRITQMYKGKERKEKLAARLEEYNRAFDKAYGVDMQNLTIKAKVFLPFLQTGFVFPVVLCSKLRHLRKR